MEHAYRALVLASALAVVRTTGQMTYDELSGCIGRFLDNTEHQGPDHTPQRFATAVRTLTGKGLLSRLGDGRGGDILAPGIGSATGGAR